MDNITVTLPVQAWNAVLAALGSRPFVEVAELIAEIKRQAEGQVAPAAPAPIADAPEPEATVQ
jgi:hypothetical protein